MSAAIQVRWTQAGRQARWIIASILATIVAGVILMQTVPQVREWVSGRPSTCFMKNALGVPCLACRGTRAALALSEGRVDRALGFNPLLTLVGIGLLGLMITVTATGKWLEVDASPCWKRLGLILLVVALIGNWIYVIAAGG